ncbi:hypothetical protein RUM44_006401 [Polyplax serrata]|uniref:Uncharacterized protein n=1 Tax=Polyplax serrata TaxID=468196 RepID=A0ABR1AJQ7_POLSC
MGASKSKLQCSRACGQPTWTGTALNRLHDPPVNPLPYSEAAYSLVSGALAVGDRNQPLLCWSRAPAGAVRAGHCASSAPAATVILSPRQCRCCLISAGQRGAGSSGDCASYAGCARTDAPPDPPTST